MENCGSKLAFSVCICTRNRPDELQDAVRSVLASSYPVHQIIISDDSTDQRTREIVTACFPNVKFLTGNRRGLATNRNNALRAVTGSHVLFIDDDVLLSYDFFDRISCFLRSDTGHFERFIVTGTECNNGLRIWPRRSNFLGYQSVPYSSGQPIHSIVINSTVFPRAVFDALQFDENLVYGYEEIDFSARAVLRHGFTIALVPEAMNRHFPSKVNRDFYAPFTEASRIYVTFKTYWWMEGRPLKAVWFLVVAYGHNLLFNIKRRGIRGLSNFASTVIRSLKYLAACFSTPSAFV